MKVIYTILCINLFGIANVAYCEPRETVNDNVICFLFDLYRRYIIPMPTDEEIKQFDKTLEKYHNKLMKEYGAYWNKMTDNQKIITLSIHYNCMQMNKRMKGQDLPPIHCAEKGGLYYSMITKYLQANRKVVKNFDNIIINATNPHYTIVKKRRKMIENCEECTIADRKQAVKNLISWRDATRVRRKYELGLFFSPERNKLDRDHLYCHDIGYTRKNKLR